MKNRFDLYGRVALVTGGGRGLGKAMARGFAEAGANVMLASRSEDELRGAAAHWSFYIFDMNCFNDAMRSERSNSSK
ncbi:MAG: SDR family NAD(P)-dependent oxidoreductase [Bryobacterales bacterium]|nr:SDR family NAD(P)-dependent oxidoreductase [Bryobacterales bacterium]